MDFETGEQQTAKWIINLFLDGNRLNGKLILTNKNVYYDIDAAFTSTGIGGADGLIKISRDDISKVEAFTAYWIFRRFKITLKDGKEYVFDRGVMPVGAIVNQLR
jgi:hypothetical protein